MRKRIESQARIERSEIRENDVVIKARWLIIIEIVLRMENFLR
jgi:hypothetical protein